MPARLRVLIAAALAALAVLAAAAVAHAAPGRAWPGPALGVGEQKPGMFTEPLWLSLGLRDVRVVAGWDALRSDWQRAELDAWMAAAEAASARVLLSFGHSRTRGRERLLPSAARFGREFAAFRRRYPRVRAYVPWNEANHCSQPTCRRPDRAAAYYDAIRTRCADCVVLGADVIDTPDMVPWLRAFQRHAQGRPRVWGLHNYLDANRFRTDGTRTLLRTVRGQIWFTETGGVVARRGRSRSRRPDSIGHAARATRWVLHRLAWLSPRIRRVYLYHWRRHRRRDTWDSALIGLNGRPRPAYHVFRRVARRRHTARRAGARAARAPAVARRVPR